MTARRWLVGYALLAAVRPVAEIIIGDSAMLACEFAWLTLFCAGLYAGG